MTYFDSKTSARCHRMNLNSQHSKTHRSYTYLPKMTQKLPDFFDLHRLCIRPSIGTSPSYERVFLA